MQPSRFVHGLPSPIDLTAVKILHDDIRDDGSIWPTLLINYIDEGHEVLWMLSGKNHVSRFRWMNFQAILGNEVLLYTRNGSCIPSQ